MTDYKGFHLAPEFAAMPKITEADARALIDEYRRDQTANVLNLGTLGRAGWHEKGRRPRPTFTPTWAETIRMTLGLAHLRYEVTVYHDRPWPFVGERAQPVITVVVVRERHGTRSYVGVARCSPCDQFSRRQGRGLALSRAIAKILGPRSGIERKCPRQEGDAP